MNPYQNMDTWASVLTPQRAASPELAEVVRKIKKVVSVDPRGMQVGNITNLLRNLREIALITQLESAITDYNERMNFWHDVYEWAGANTRQRNQLRYWKNEVLDDPEEIHLLMTSREAVTDIQQSAKTYGL